MSPINKLFMLTVKQTLQAKNIENVFFFNKQGSAGNAADLAAAFVADWSPTLRSIQSAQLHWNAIDVINLGDDTDFESLPQSVVGAAGDGDTLPAFNAIGYTLKTVTRAIKPGSKRFAGVLEAVVTNGVAVEPTFVLEIEAVRILLDDTLVGDDDSYDHVVVKRVKELIPDTEPPKFSYRLPETDGECVVGLVKQAFSNLTVTSQVSRKD